MTRTEGYATGAFEVTPERLGTYLPVRLELQGTTTLTEFSPQVEHIDNPKGYGEGEDPRKYHPKLRGPVHPQEYAVDPDSGMKNYIANERGNWDTSRAHVRRLLGMLRSACITESSSSALLTDACIDFGRRYRQGKNQNDKFEAYRLLGSAVGPDFLPYNCHKLIEHHSCTPWKVREFEFNFYLMSTD